MKSGIFILSLYLMVLVSVAFSVVYSRHGLFDLRRLQDQLSQARVRVEKLEDENKKLRRQWDLLASGSEQVTERQIREVLGYVRSHELVYFERR